MDGLSEQTVAINMNNTANVLDISDLRVIYSLTNNMCHEWICDFRSPCMTTENLNTKKTHI
jgi:hypothetical protein